MACIFAAMKTKTPHPGAPALRAAIKKAGGLKQLATLIGGKTQSQTVANWISRGTPMERCALIQRLTGVRCEDLRPDLDWTALRDAFRDDDADVIASSDDVQPPDGGVPPETGDTSR
jgi:DNA-binding transcriptional regulator YdaS (Cro superfamily)